jgi:chitin synthase
MSTLNVTAFTAHIFFDDAFELSEESDEDYVVNSFVKYLMETVDPAAKDVHGTDCYIQPPVKFPTPYGGRLVWTLPGKTKMIAHLKNKDTIRHKKRWSQVKQNPFFSFMFVCGWKWPWFNLEHSTPRRRQ